ncbi:hypothetical protein M2145_002297 [Lachnospiraceae bacterium PF1-21]
MAGGILDKLNCKRDWCASGVPFRDFQKTNRNDLDGLYYAGKNTDFL